MAAISPDSSHMTTVPELQELSGNSLRAFNAWLTLTDDEKEDFSKATDYYLPLIGIVRDITINVHTGPFETSCPFCGRGNR